MSDEINNLTLAELATDLLHQAAYRDGLGNSLYAPKYMVSNAILLHSTPIISRVVYDRVRKRKNYFEILAFLQIERGKSRAGKFKTSNENKNVFVFI